MYAPLFVWISAFLVQCCSGLMHKITFGGENLGFIRELLFDVIAKKEMQCFNEFFTANSLVNVYLRAVNVQSQKVQMRVTSSTGEFSEWFEGIDRTKFSGVAQEDGPYEVCVSTSVKTGQYVRLLLTIQTEDRNRANIISEQSKEKEQSQKNMQGSVYRMLNSMFNSKIALRQLNAEIMRDMHLQVKNANYIDTFSLMQTVIMLCAAGIQVFFIRKFFNINTAKIRI